MSIERYNTIDSLFTGIDGRKWKTNIKPGTVFKPTWMSYPDEEFRTLLTETNILVAVKDLKTIELIYSDRSTSTGPWKHSYTENEINEDFI